MSMMDHGNITLLGAGRKMRQIIRLLCFLKIKFPMYCNGEIMRNKHST
jgi:hypothetical protein